MEKRSPFGSESGPEGAAAIGFQATSNRLRKQAQHSIRRLGVRDM